MNRDLRDLFKALIDQGWLVERRRSNHFKIVSPSGGIYFSAGTPSDRRGVLNMKAALKRMGATL